MDLIFQTQKGTPFAIEVGYFDTVQEIKEKIHKEHGLPVTAQTLIFNGNVLADDLNVHDSDILDRSHINLHISADEKSSMSPPPPPPPPPPPKAYRKLIRISLKIPASNKPAVTLETDAGDTVRRLKERIQETEGVPAGRITLHASGTELSDNRTLSDYQLSDHSQVDVTVKPSPPSTTTSSGSSGNTGGPKKLLRVMVLSRCGTKKFPVEVNPADNVGELRKELERLNQSMQLQLPDEGYFFIYKQNVMDDDRSFRWHNVGQGDTIEIFNGSVTGGS